MRLLLTVDEVVLLRERGLALLPEVSPDLLVGFATGETRDVLLRQPDGGERVVQASFVLEHFRPAGLKWICYLAQARKDGVPPGTEVWLFGERETPTRW